MTEKTKDDAVQRKYHQITADQRRAIHARMNEEHRQVKVGRCSCGAECKSGGRFSREMWKSHRIYQEVRALREAALRPNACRRCGHTTEDDGWDCKEAVCIFRGHPLHTWRVVFALAGLAK